MQVIRESAEHHFLTTFERLKSSPKNWVALSFSFARLLAHKSLIEKPETIPEKIKKMRDTSAAFGAELERSLNFKAGYIYIFADGDVLALVSPENDNERETMQRVFAEMSKRLAEGLSDMTMLAAELLNLQKFSDRKLLSARRFEAYMSMSDANKVASIRLRRDRREEPKVMIVEDDRFTAAYTANILSKEYDLQVCRNGEDAVLFYIEHAPDIVFLDIHLPGLNGHETLEAIRAIDPQAFIVMLSVDAERNSIIQASTSGASKFLKKPFSKERILEVVKNSPYVRGAYVPPPGSGDIAAQ